jgi:hypothetical protein
MLSPVPNANIHPMPTEGLEPEAAAALYECTLVQFYGAQELAADKPLFDVVAFLVTGEDKRVALRHVLDGDTMLPAARLLPRARCASSWIARPPAKVDRDRRGPPRSARWPKSRMAWWRE